MTEEGLSSLAEIDQHRPTIEIGRKRVERSKSFMNTVNKELQEMEQLIMDALGPNEIDIASDYYGQSIHRKRYPLSLVESKID
ncbi:MAG: hypothetical protein A4E65_01901 [Syntrophorhabdus sp. PtaU1.Bin153]|nr:MAG: hypothetical protein A4E65_01901 [Syntrophorhabdus sp. PtaU1.Bin153]